MQFLRYEFRLYRKYGNNAKDTGAKFIRATIIVDSRKQKKSHLFNELKPIVT